VTAGSTLSTAAPYAAADVGSLAWLTSSSAGRTRARHVPLVPGEGFGLIVEDPAIEVDVPMTEDDLYARVAASLAI
jgi:hypothetical protein